MSYATRARATVLRVLRRYGTAATLTHLPGGVADSIRVAPVKAKQVVVDGRVVETLFETVMDGQDPNLTAAPKAGDQLTIGVNSWRLVVGTRPMYAQAAIAGYALVLKSA